MKNKESTPKRSEQRLLKKKELSRKIYLRSLILLGCAGILIGVGLGILYTVEQQQLKVQIADETSDILKHSQKKQEQTGVETTEKIAETDKVTKVTYLPTEAENIPIDNFEKEVARLMDEATQKYEPNQPTILIGRLGFENYTEQLTSYRVTVDTYQWTPKENTFKQLKTTAGEPTYLNQKTGKPITSQDLISEEANLLGIQQVIQQRLLDEAKEPKKIINDVLDFPRINWETKMTYTPDALEISLPKNDLGATDIRLPYKDIQSFIRTDLVNPKFLSDQVRTLDPNEKYIALTFDDGPMAKTTPKILEILQKKKVRATFFMLGQNAKEYPDLVKQIHEDGHELASHSYSHPQLTGLSDKEIENEVKNTDKVIFDATGVLPKTFRPPYGAVNPTVAQVIGKPIIQWNIDSLDWQSKSKNAVIQMIQQTSNAGGIVLMHDIQPATADALETVIDHLINEGYQFATIEELLEYNTRPLYQYFGQADQRKI
ncbi:polysaccharide deacetylase family protein [Enterococcus sp. LJL98]